MCSPSVHLCALRGAPAGSNLTRVTDTSSWPVAVEPDPPRYADDSAEEIEELGQNLEMEKERKLGRAAGKTSASKSSAKSSNATKKSASKKTSGKKKPASKAAKKSGTKKAARGRSARAAK